MSRGAPQAEGVFFSYQPAFCIATLIALQEGDLDGAMHLAAPPGPARYAHTFFDRMEDVEVSVQQEEPSEEYGVWALATGGPERLTLLAAQWHSLEEDAESRTLSVELSGLDPGRYTARLYRIDKNNPGSNDPDEVFLVDNVRPVRLDLPLDGQSVAFLELEPD